MSLTPSQENEVRKKVIAQFGEGGHTADRSSLHETQ